MTKREKIYLGVIAALLINTFYMQLSASKNIENLEAEYATQIETLNASKEAMRKKQESYQEAITEHNKQKAENE